MISKIWRWLKDYPTAALEVSGEISKYISLDKNLKPSAAMEGYPEEADKNILLNLTEEDLGVIILNVEDSVGKKYIKNHLSWELKRRLPDDMNFDFEYQKVGRGRYLVKYYRKNTLTQIKERLELENAIISSTIIGYYNYWNYYRRSIGVEVRDLLLICIGGRSSQLLFIEGEEISYMRSVRIGGQELDDHIKRSKFIKEVAHTLILQKNSIEKIFLLGEGASSVELQSSLKDFLEREIFEIEVEDEMHPYIGMLGNLYSYHLS